MQRFVVIVIVVVVLPCHLLRYPFSFDLLHLSIAFGVAGIINGAFWRVDGCLI